MSKHPPDPKYFNVQRGRTSKNHKTNCAEGYRPGGKTPDKDYCQIHHVLPISSVQDASIKEWVPDEQEFRIARKSFGLTSWDVDQTDNVIGLPLKRAFVSKLAPQKDLWNLPCHIYGHPQYTQFVKASLVVLVWDKIVMMAEECPPASNEAIQGEVEATSKYSFDWLKSRGAGTKICWKKRRYMKGWYIPFSMDPGKPAEVKPPPTMDDFANDMKDALSNLFKKQ